MTSEELIKSAAAKQVAASATHLRVVAAGDADKTLPHVPEAERATIAALLTKAGGLGEVHDFLRPEHFYIDAHRSIFDAVVHLCEANGVVDKITVATWLRERGLLEKTGGLDFIESVIAKSGPESLRSYGESVHESWRARQTILFCRRVAAQGCVDHGNVQSYIDGATRGLAEIGRLGVGARFESNVAALRRILSAISDRAEGEQDPTRVVGIPTGLAAFDRRTNGLRAGTKTVVVALPGRGKTAFAMQAALNAARRGVGVLVFEMDMTQDELLIRLMSMMAGIESARIEAGRMTRVEWTRLTDVVAELESLPIWIDDSSDIHIGQVRARTLAQIERARDTLSVPVGLVVLDYVQNLKPAPEVFHKKTHEQIEHSTEEFKGICKELQVAGLELAQQKQSDVDKFTKVRPKPSTGCVAGSAQIERSGDVVVFLHRKPQYGKAGKIVGEDPSSILMILDKQRGGWTGEIDLTFQREYTRFVCDASVHEAERLQPESRRWIDRALPAGDSDERDDQ